MRHGYNLNNHTLKEIVSGREVRSFFCFRPSSTTDAFNVVIFKGVIYLSSPDHGALTLMPFAPDALIWLENNAHDDDALVAAVPDNLHRAVWQYEPDEEEYETIAGLTDGAQFFLAALRRFLLLLRRDA
jgi:hypothetical protein